MSEGDEQTIVAKDSGPYVTSYVSDLKPLSYESVRTARTIVLCCSGNQVAKNPIAMIPIPK